ncbi:ABC transporter permease [Halostella sp. JP-L12]|uniref:ABC transporter permease n=1 Tax=Halostella TaxID=1843185 RepID=UPI000EF7CB81|nr:MULTISPECIES: ABC transporter permease [Halostella]NHN49303.1 ABC transporter permease [Halostella sp. JP-L12]
MASTLRYVIGLVLAAHGIVHLLGTAAYLQLARFPELPYKTTVLGGRLDLGPTGISVFGALWAVAAVGFVAAAVGLVADWRQWRPLLVGTTLLSLGLTVLDWPVAAAGVVVNLGILAGLTIHARQ